MRKLVSAALLGAILTLGAGSAFAHCQVPCGIYTDEMRFHMIAEDTATIEKAMTKITEIGGSDYNQVVRWVMTKEEHAQKIQDVVNAYFLTQRIKVTEEPGEDYYTSLRLCHEMLVYAMKCKQGTDAANVAKLRAATAAFHDHYFGDKEHDHHE